MDFINNAFKYIFVPNSISSNVTVFSSVAKCHLSVRREHVGSLWESL